MAGKFRIAHHVTSEATTVLRCLEKHFRLDTAQAQELIALGSIYMDRKRVFEDRKLEKGAYLRIHLQPKRFPVTGVDWKRVLVHETSDFIVVRKPAGIPVHATLDNHQDNVLSQLRERRKTALLVTNRLDVPVAGLLLLAKTPAFQARFNNWLAERKVTKLYRALTETAPAIGKHVHFMEPSERCPKQVSVEEKPQWQRCELSVRSVDALTLGDPAQGYHESLIELHTGRTHQIRAQLQALHCPIVGDQFYGSSRRYTHGPANGEAIGLFSAYLSFPNASGKVWEFQAEPCWRLTPRTSAEAPSPAAV